MENTKHWWKGPIKQQLHLAGFLTRAHHNLEENHSDLSQQLFKTDYSLHPPASALPHRAARSTNSDG